MNYVDFKKTLSKINFINEEAKLVLELINEIKPIEGFDYLDEIKFDEETVDFKGYKYYGRGVDENYEYSFPSNILYDLEERNLFLNNLKKEISDKLREDNAKAEINKKNKENEDYELYLRMKNRFEV